MAAKDFRKVVRASRQHRALAVRAAREAEALLPLFERVHPRDRRPRRAIEAIGAWGQGTRALNMAAVRRLSLDAHAAARAAKTASARYAARAAGHAVAVWHVPQHAVGPSLYGRKAREVMATKDLELIDALKPVGKAFASDKEVVHYKATSLCVGKKVFAMIVDGHLVVKLPAERAQDLVDAGKGKFHALGARVMKEWFVSPPARKKEWVSVAKESRKFVGG
jgi:hypothetical protein